MRKSYSVYEKQVVIYITDITEPISSRAMVMDAWSAFDKAVSEEWSFLLRIGYRLVNSYPTTWFSTGWGEQSNRAHQQFTSKAIEFKNQEDLDQFIAILIKHGYDEW